MYIDIYMHFDMFIIHTCIYMNINKSIYIYIYKHRYTYTYMLLRQKGQSHKKTCVCSTWISQESILKVSFYFFFVCIKEVFSNFQSR